MSAAKRAFPPVLITGTDTGVGKTLVMALLADWMRGHQVQVGVRKLVETGCFNQNGKLIPADGSLLAPFDTQTKTVDDIVPWKFEPPTAPLVAARARGEELSPDALSEYCEALKSEYELLLIEGAGGLLVPIAEGFSYAELASRIGALVIVVVGSRLGVLNHACLTFEVLKTRAIPTLGYVFNDLFQGGGSLTREHSENMALQTNRELLLDLAEAYEIEELGYVPHCSDSITPESVRKLGSHGMIQRLGETTLRGLNRRLGA